MSEELPCTPPVKYLHGIDHDFPKVSEYAGKVSRTVIDVLSMDFPTGTWLALLVTTE
jgi:hypothetical protein